MMVQRSTRFEDCLTDSLEIHMDDSGSSPRCEISSNALVHGYVVACDSSVVTVNGGRVRFELAGTDASVISLCQGRVGGLISSLGATIHFTGGRVDEEMFVSFGGTLHWSGGEVGGVLKVASNRAVVHVYGNSLSFGPANTIWGTLEDGHQVGPLPFQLLLGAERDQIILHSGNSDTVSTGADNLDLTTSDIESCCEDLSRLPFLL